MAQSIVPLVIVLLASSLALSNVNGIGNGPYTGFCQGKADGLYANPQYSHTFYQCSNSLTYIKSCPANLVFNPAISVCDWPVVNSVFCQGKADGMYPDPSDFHSFYHCSNSLTYHKQCPANLVFNPSKNRCDWDVADVAPATTQGANKPLNSVFCQSKANGLYANPSDSHSFYQCSNSLTYLKQCPSNLVFNPAISVCDWPVSHDDATAITKGAPIPPYLVDFCKTKVDGMFADPGNSNAFYHCSNHNTYYKPCQQGLVFNQLLGACVWPSQGV